MIGTVREWLPVGVADRAPVRGVIDQAIAAWSLRWFAGRELGVTSYVSVSGVQARPPEGATWATYPSGVALAAAPRGLARLVDLALDAQVDALGATPLDQAIVKVFEARLLEDLIHAVETALQLECSRTDTATATRQPFSTLGGVVVGVGEGRSGERLALALPLSLLMSLCRESLPPRSTVRPRYTSLSKALASRPVTVTAHLGSTEIQLEDLKGLAKGDILVLDAPLAGAIELRLKTSEHLLARAELSDADGAMALTLLP